MENIRKGEIRYQDQKYNNSYLETEARSVVGKLKEMYRNFCEAIKG